MFKNLAFTLLAILAISCSDDVKPKPKGELRLDYPQPKYQLFNNNCAYTFEYSDFAQIVDAKKSCWYYLRYPKMKANVFCHNPGIFFLGSHSSKSKKRQKEVQQFTIKTGIRKRIFNLLFFDVYPNKRSELTTAIKDGKSPNQVNATLERMLVAKSTYNVLVLFFSDVLNNVNTA